MQAQGLGFETKQCIIDFPIHSLFHSAKEIKELFVFFLSLSLSREIIYGTDKRVY